MYVRPTVRTREMVARMTPSDMVAGARLSSGSSKLNCPFGGFPAGMVQRSVPGGIWVRLIVAFG